jgi:hypothetical protein
MNWITGLLLAGLFACAGCGKSDKGNAQSIPATMDLAKFSQAFESPTPEQQASMAKVREGVRYRLYPKALEGLDALLGDSSLTEPQKKAVNDMIQGVKAAIASAPAGQAQ